MQKKFLALGRKAVRITERFNEQFQELSSKSQERIKTKVKLIVENPYRFKRLNAKYPLFRIRINIDGKDSRIIYGIFEEVVIILIIERKKGYKNLEKEIERILRK